MALEGSTAGNFDFNSISLLIPKKVSELEDVFTSRCVLPLTPNLTVRIRRNISEDSAEQPGNEALTRVISPVYIFRFRQMGLRCRASRARQPAGVAGVELDFEGRLSFKEEIRTFATSVCLSTSICMNGKTTELILW